FPNQIVPSPQNIIALDPITGTFSWNSPQLDGEYNIAMIIVEYRNGNPLDTLIRDMQITIENCENQPPQITTIDKICVVAGDTIAFDVIATDPNNDEVEITPFGGPLVVATSPATFNVPAGFNTPPVIGRFQWITDCNHISDQYYSIIFRAADNYVIIDSTSGLSTLKVVRIKVVGPPPQDVNAIVENGGIDVTWQRPYACEDALDNYFRGFSVWRREGSNPFELDTCVTGLDGRGYTQLNFNTNEVIGDRYYFRDTNISRGKTYCYRILANFAKVSPGGNPFNAVESLPSQEACTQLGRDIPLLTNVSVLTTQATTGELWLRWSKPVAADLDTVLNPPPYTYKLLRANGLTGTNFTEVVSFTKPTFASANDTIFTDTNRNTVDLGYNYKLQFFTGNSATEPLGESEAASSVYLTIASSDRQNTLSWQPVVPWANFQTVIYRKNNSTNNFDSIAVVTQNNFLDDELINGEEYCYYVKTIGSYGISGIVDPLENLSQQACGVPLDTVPPCPPMLSVANICTDNTLALTDVQNLLNWTQPIRQCLNATDVTQYRIYFADNNSAELQLIESLNNVNDTTWIHNLDFSLAGCYAVTAVDSVGNESAKSNLVCVDNCPYYTLPNTFTPNGDGQNDFFKPYPYKFIESIDFQVFNRWGNQIFSTQNPDILWGGTTNSGEILPAGVYFYTCKVFERRVQGILQNATVLSGYIELLKE
ncbi:MAG: gliding motility-associated C-terminal domain-containing protein, partial [Saprospiraceae bacterium]